MNKFTRSITTHGVLLLCIITLLCAQLGCKKQTRRTRSLAEGKPVNADSPDAQRAFDAGIEALEQGRYEEGRQAFEALQAEHGNDAIAPVAELYAARAELGALTLGFGTLSSGIPAETIRATASRFTALADARRVDARIRWSARLYEAMTLVILGQHDRALALLEDYPSASMGNTILEEDRVMGWMLILEAMRQDERADEAFVASAMLYERAQDIKDLTLSDQIMSYARRQGADLALHDIDAGALQMQFLTSDIAFLRGYAGWALVVQNKDSGDENRAVLEEILAQSSPALIQIGALEQVVEASTHVATMGTSKRLLVGAVVPMRGESKGIGARVMRGMLLAQEAFSGQAQPGLTLVFRDSTLPAKENMAWFASQDVLAVIGPIEKESVPDYVKHATEQGVTLLPLTPTPLAPLEDTGQKPWAFRHFLDIESEAKAVAQISARQYGDKTAAIIWPGVGYGRTMAQTFKEAFEAEGGTIVAEVEYPRQDTEFARTAAKISKARPDAIFIADTGSKVSEITAFLAKDNVWGVPGDRTLERKTRLQTHYLGTSLWQDAFLTRQASSYVAGATIPAWYSKVSKDDQSKLFRGRYGEVYADGEPSIYEAFAYDTVNMLANVVVTRGMHRPSTVRDALLLGEWEGVTGKIDFTPSGEPDRELRFITVKGDMFAPLDVTQQVEVVTEPAATPPEEL